MQAIKLPPGFEIIQCGNGGTAMKRGNHSSQRKAGGGGGDSGEAVQPKDLPEGVAVQDFGKKREYTTEVDGVEVTLTVDKGEASLRSAGGDAEISFTVGGTYNQGALSGREAVRAAFKVREMAKYDASTRPDGFVYTARAYSGDGSGEARTKAYEKFGFSKPKTVGDFQFQYAIVRNGKLQPHTP